MKDPDHQSDLVIIFSVRNTNEKYSKYDRYNAISPYYSITRLKSIDRNLPIGPISMAHRSQRIQINVRK